MNNFPLGVKCHKVLCVGNHFYANGTYAYNVKCRVHNKRYSKGQPFLLDSTIPNKTYTCIFCNILAFCESRCGECMFVIISHLPSPSIIALLCMLVYHPNAKGENWKALKTMNQLTKTYLKENPNASPKTICYKLAQWEFL